MSVQGRLEGKVGIVVGAGQTAGEGVGTGRAAAITFARAGAKLLLVDRDLTSVQETARLIFSEGGEAAVIEGDWTQANDCQAFVAACQRTYGRVDFLQNNVGVGGRGDGDILETSEEGFDWILNVNLKGCFLSCQAVLPVMQDQQSGSIVNISSIGAVTNPPHTAYKVSKAGMNALGQLIAARSAQYGVRVNTIMPGLIETPIAIEARVASGQDREVVKAERDRRVPLKQRMGDAWDIAHASLFLHSEEARFITGVILPVDGGQCTRFG